MKKVLEFMRKRVWAVLLVLFLFGSSVVAFAIWDSLEDDASVVVPIGQGVTLSVNLAEQTTGNLVPAGVVMKTGDVDEVVIEFTVLLDSSELIDPLDLDVVISNVQIDGSTDNIGLVVTSIDKPKTIQNSAVTVTITVTLTEPTTQAEYNAIINSDITFDITFTATQQ